ncbi:MAG: hypothetical protein WBB45_08725 [Cyclobacteriaceae bacterium]
MENIPLLLTLIKEDLKLNAFLNSINKAGLLIETYSPQISDAIFKMAGIPSGDDDLYDMYWNFLDGLEYAYVCENLELLSTKFYAELVAFRRQHPQCRRHVRQAS